MDHDLVFILGLILGVFSFPAMVSAWSDRRAPRVAALVVVMAGIMILWAVRENPGRYLIEGLPDMFLKVVRTYLA